MQVFATDLWVPATENYNRFRERGLDGRIVPIHADVHELPYAEMKAEGGRYFDTIGLIAEVK